MSSAPQKPQLSKHRAAFARSKAKKSSQKDHGFDARNYHQNANRREIRSLVKFDCPVCQCKNTAIVQCEAKRMLATVRCGVCLSLQPPPEDLPYPYQTSYVPKLENKADIFFKFLDAYRRVVEQGEHTATLRGTEPFLDDEDQEGLANGGQSAFAPGMHLLDGLEMDVELLEAEKNHNTAEDALEDVDGETDEEWEETIPEDE